MYVIGCHSIFNDIHMYIAMPTLRWCLMMMCVDLYAYALTSKTEQTLTTLACVRKHRFGILHGSLMNFANSTAMCPSQLSLVEWFKNTTRSTHRYKKRMSDGTQVPSTAYSKTFQNVKFFQDGLFSDNSFLYY